MPISLWLRLLILQPYRCSYCHFLTLRLLAWTNLAMTAELSDQPPASRAFVTGPSADPLPLDLLQGKVQEERQYGYTKDGKKKRILLNAFDMNGVGHIRFVCRIPDSDAGRANIKEPAWANGRIPKTRARRRTSSRTGLSWPSCWKRANSMRYSLVSNLMQLMS